LGLGDGNARGLGDLLGLLLVHRQRRGQHARMGVGNGQIFENTLDGSILAERAMQRVETDIRLERTQNRADIATDVDLAHLVAYGLQGNGTGIPRRQRYRPLGRKPTHEHGDMLVLHSPSSPLTAAPPHFRALSPSLPAGCPPDGKRARGPLRLKSGNALNQRIRELIRWQVPRIPEDSLSGLFVTKSDSPESFGSHSRDLRAAHISTD